MHLISKSLILIAFTTASTLYCMNHYDELPYHDVIVKGKDIFIIPSEEQPAHSDQTNLTQSGSEDEEEFDINKSYGHPNGHMPLISASTYKGSPELIKLLISHKADVNKPVECTGWTPLHHACHYNPEAIEPLILNGASPTACEKSGVTPIFLAINPNKASGADPVANTKAFLEAVAKRKELRARKKDLNNNNY